MIKFGKLVRPLISLKNKIILTDRFGFKFYQFDFSSNKLIPIDINKSSIGKIFFLCRQKYIIFNSDNSLKIYNNLKKNFLEPTQVNYCESRLFCTLCIIENSNITKIKCRKSIWEIINISTYDYLDKIDDNELFHFYCLLKEYLAITNNDKLIEYLNNL